MTIEQRMSWSKFWARFFATISLSVPPIVIVYMAWDYKNWWLLLGILFSFLGGIMAFIKNYTFIALASIFCIAFWIRGGFNFHQYITFFYFCTLFEFYCTGTMNQFQGQWEDLYNRKKELDSSAL